MMSTRTLLAAARWVASLLGILVFLVLSAVFIVPRLAGAASYTILTGSMEPTISPGDVIVVKPAEYRDIKVGDVVTFHPKPNDPTLITHRVIAKTQGTYQQLTTRGDANGADDKPIKPEQVVGKFWYRVPAVGHVTNPLRNSIGSNAPIAVGVLTALGLFWMFMPERKKDEGSASTRDASDKNLSDKVESDETSADVGDPASSEPRP